MDSMSQPAPSLNPTRLKLEQLSHPAHPLCREDVIWMLEFIKKKVAEPDPHLMDLTQPQLLQHFHEFAEVAMKLIYRRPSYYIETEKLKAWIELTIH
jgi:hypothetical protein